MRFQRRFNRLQRINIMATISRDYSGYHLENCKPVDKETQEIVIHALGSYGFLVRHNERITVRTWIARIKSNYAHSARLLSICACLLAIS